MLNAYWEYAGTRYKHKFQAIQASNKDIDNITYHMFDGDVFENFDWSIEPAESLKSLMTTRAYQLRDQYPYLKFWFSGGADSTSALNIFLDNDIFIDEICVFKFGNNLSNYEIDNYTLPHLREIKHLIPNTKITTYTFDEEYYREYLNDKWFFTKNALCPRHFHLPKIKGKNFCHIFCACDPQLQFEDGEYKIVLYDTHTTGELASYRNIELFYTSPSLPELHSKQCHILKRHLTPDFDLEDEKRVLREYLRYEPIAPTPSFLKKNYGNIQAMHVQPKNKYIFQTMDKFFTSQLRYVLNTKINGIPVFRTVKGYSAHKFSLGV